MAAELTTPAGESCYRAFGLRIHSEIPLPELPQAAADDAIAADVQVRLGAVDPNLPDAQEIEPGVYATRDQLLLDFREARYRIRNGCEIVVEPAPGASDRDVRIYLLGSAMGAIFHQRGLLPLHANAIEIDGQAVAFVGPSGAGKSTLAAHFHRLGRRVLCDDVCVVSFDAAGIPMAWPGVPRIKLWSDALKAFGRDDHGLQPVGGGLDKYSLPMPGELPHAPLPLARIYMLEQASAEATAGIRVLAGAEAVDALVNNIYRWEFTAPLGRSEAQFANALSLLKRSRMFAASRAWGFDVFEAEAAKLEQHMGIDCPGP